MKKIAVIGGGPGGLYFSILTKKAMPHLEIEVFERNKADDAFGFGVVFSDETLSEFLARDPESYQRIRDSFAYWDNLDVVRNGQRVRIAGNGFCGCSRKTLLQLLQQRCREEGVILHFESDVNTTQLPNADLIVACDGINSQIRTQFEKEFQTKTTLMHNKFVWLGSTKPLDAFAYFFRQTPHGAIVAHSYQYEAGRSTWIFECAPDTWEKLNFETTDEADTIEKLEQLFAEELEGHPLISNKSHWRQFPEVINGKWHHNNIVLLGDAKATAHYSIGSGTKLAMECAIALSDAVVAHPDNLSSIFDDYDKRRRQRVEAIQHAARVSLDWFEGMDRHMRHPFMQFAFGVMTRAKKVTYENLQLRDKQFTDAVLHEFSNGTDTSPAFTPIKIGGIEVINRIAMLGIEQQMADNGAPADWHLVYYGARATGGTGLIITEPVYAESTSEKLLQLKSEIQIDKWLSINNFIHKNSDAKSMMRLALSSENTSIIALAQAAQNARHAGFDFVMLDAGTGSVLNTMLSDTDQICEYFTSVKNSFGSAAGVALHLTDNYFDRKTHQSALRLAEKIEACGAAFLNVTSSVPGKNPGRMYQTPLADLIRSAVSIPVFTSGAISDIDQINTILLTGRADVIALGRPFLLDPGFVRRAQAHENYRATDIPSGYQSGIIPFYTAISTERREKEQMKKALKPESHQKPALHDTPRR